MKIAGTMQQQVNIITLLIQLVIFAIWMFFILMDAVLASTSLEEATYWLPWVLMGWLIGWQMIDWVQEDKPWGVILLVVPYFALADFVQG
jgi:hypothetical protein